MRQALLLLTAFCLLASVGYAQTEKAAKKTKIYVKAGGGYSFPHAGQVDLASAGFIINGSATTTTTQGTSERKKSSYGAGVKATIAAGLTITDNIGVELGIGAGIAPKKYKFRSIDEANARESNFTSRARMPIYIMPAIVLQTSGGKVNIYSRLGLALPLGGKILIEQETTDQPFQEVSTSTIEIKSRFGIGFQGGLGARFAIAERLGLYIEANGLSMNRYAKSGELTESSVNGISNLSLASVADKEVAFEFDLTETINGSQNPDEPTKAPTFNIPFSNVGLEVGLHFLL